MYLIMTSKGHHENNVSKKGLGMKHTACPLQGRVQIHKGASLLFIYKLSPTV
jgi:hypothetical protein